MSRTNPTLLSALSATARAPGLARAAGAPGAESFERLLARAQVTPLETALPVSIASGAGIELTDSQLVRLSSVVDRAQQAGATRLLVVMDGASLDVDVLARRVLGVADLSDERVLTDFDGVVRLDGRMATGEVLPPPSSGAGGAWLARALASRSVA